MKQERGERGERERRKERYGMTTSASRCRRHFFSFWASNAVSLSQKRKESRQHAWLCETIQRGENTKSLTLCECGNQADQTGMGATSLVVGIMFKAVLALATANAQLFCIAINRYSLFVWRVFACRCRDASNCILTPMNGRP